jgi:peptidoglycan/xylan/chitin deacetylase (PgdA/CDA1 family)
MPVRKRAVGEALAGARAMSWLLRLPLWRGAVVLAYHRMGEGPDQTPFHPGMLSATPAAFDAQLGFLRRHFDVVSPEAIEREPDARGRRVLVTFDDGYRDNHQLALPLLRKHGLPATFFLATGFLDDPKVPWWDELAWIVKQSDRAELEPGEWLDRPVPLSGDRHRAIEALTGTYGSLPSDRTEAFLDFCAESAGTGRCDPRAGAELWMTWEMATELRDAGMTIGGHTHTHPVLARADPQRQRQEVEECLGRLREELNVSTRFFAYPVGQPTAFDGVTRRVVREAGVALAFSLYGGHLRPGRLDPYDIPRATVGIWTSLHAFRAMLASPQLFARW